MALWWTFMKMKIFSYVLTFPLGLWARVSCVFPRHPCLWPSIPACLRLLATSPSPVPLPRGPCTLTSSRFYLFFIRSKWAHVSPSTVLTGGSLLQGPLGLPWRRATALLLSTISSYQEFKMIKRWTRPEFYSPGLSYTLRWPLANCPEIVDICWINM